MGGVWVGGGLECKIEAPFVSCPGAGVSSHSGPVESVGVGTPSGGMGARAGAGPWSVPGGYPPDSPTGDGGGLRCRVGEGAEGMGDSGGGG